MKKLFALVLALAMTLSLAACGGSSSSAGNETAPAAEGSAPAAAEAPAEAAPAGEGTHIYVLTASEDHGWTGSVATFAKEKAEEVNAGGKYTAEVITAADAAEQITKLEDIVASGEENIAIVIQPMDDTVQSAIQQVVDAGIPYVAFDRIIDAVAPSAVSNVKGDNEGIGAGSAAYFVSLGMKPGDKVYVYEGDTSSVTALRDQGFTDYLTKPIRQSDLKQMLMDYLPLHKVHKEEA
jgi:ribose transport system substrate-binding protein